MLVAVVVQHTIQQMILVVVHRLKSQQAPVHMGRQQQQQQVQVHTLNEEAEPVLVLVLGCIPAGQILRVVSRQIQHLLPLENTYFGWSTEGAWVEHLY